MLPCTLALDGEEDNGARECGRAGWRCPHFLSGVNETPGLSFAQLGGLGNGGWRGALQIAQRQARGKAAGAMRSAEVFYWPCSLSIERKAGDRVRTWKSSRRSTEQHAFR